MMPEQLALKYLEALEGGSLSGILALFANGAQVVSPLYGQINASEFYPQLLMDTHQSKISLKGVFDEKNGEKIAIYFNYQWTMKDDTVVSFDVVDILELEGYKIKKLTIIYDTFKTRLSFEKLRK